MPGVETVAVHGTSQEITSNDELTVRLVRRLRSRGLPVTEIGGPGSTERSMLRVLALDDTLKEWGLTALDELPSFNLDYVPPVVAGALTGAGASEIVAEGVDAIRRIVKSGATEVNLVGFSRGAVIVAMILEELRKNNVVPPGTTVSVGLLDPVPGPVGLPKIVTIPAFVDKLVLFVSRDEGRPGFAHADVRLESARTKVHLDILKGVHGDIGGSTRSPLFVLAEDAFCKAMGLPGPYLSLDEIGERIVDTIEDGERYSMPSWPFRLSPRRFSGWPGRESAARSGDLELPSAHMADTFWQISPVMRALRSARSDWLESAQRHARSWERRLLDDIERRQQAATGNIAMTIPHRPVVVQPAGSIAYPPPTSIALPMIGKRAVKKLIFRR